VSHPTKKLSLLAAAAVVLVCGAASAQHIDGPFPVPPEPVKGIVEGPLPLGAVVLDRPFDYDWWYGCSPTAAGMYFGWWDEHGYPNVFPRDHRDWVLGLDCPNFDPANFEDAHGTVASWEHHQSGQDYGWKYGFWRGHPPACLADFMLTRNGGTDRSTMEWGFENFAAWDDPETPENESYSFSAETYYVDKGWTYEDYCAEIDAGRPVHLGMSYYSGGGHSVLGLGYNNTGGKRNVYLHTTWHFGLVEWPWEDPLGWTVNGGTTMQPGTEPVPEFSGYFAISHEEIGALRVWIGAGDPACPDWEVQVWNLQGYDFVNLVQTDIDLTDALDLFRGQWYLKVTDSGSGQTGHIEDFQLRLSGQRWFTDDVHVAIPSGGTAYAYIDLPSPQVHVDQNAPGPEHNGSSWDTAFLTIQEGVDAATPYGEVWVADGLYIENVVLGEGVTVYGGFLGAEPGGYETELDQRNYTSNVAAIDGNQSGSCVTMAESSTLDGFTLTNGTGTDEVTLLHGGGVYAYRTSLWTLANCAITGNTTTVGGGISMNRSQNCLIAHCEISRNSCANVGGGIWASECHGTVIENNIISDNTAGYGGGFGLFGNDLRSAGGFDPILVAGNIIARNAADGGHGGGVYAVDDPVSMINNTIVENRCSGSGGGVLCYATSLINNIIARNTAGDAGGGVYNYAVPAYLSHNDVWANIPDDYSGCEPGDGDISEDPLFADPQAGDYHLTIDSTCTDAGDNASPYLSALDWDGEDRVTGDAVDIGADEYVTYYTEAPDPEPECGGPLFGGSQAGYPAWVWFSIPLTPDCVVGSGCADPNALLGFDCSGRLWHWDKYGKSSQVYRPPFITWDLAAGDGYLLYLEAGVTNPGYEGITPFIPWSFDFKLGRIGWTWIGMPGLAERAGSDFMSSVRVKYPSDDTGEYRTAQSDYDATPGNWTTWSWSYWNAWLQAPETFTPYAPFGHNTCYPWLGYRLWVNVGTAMSPDDPDQVTLIWPESQ
jgi:hypothetical protein